jgi:hypothetical protein
MAAIARILSNVPIVAGADAAGAARWAVGAGRDCATGAAAERGAAAAAADGLEIDGAAADGNGTLPDAPVGPPGGSVGSLMVGAAVGLGGRLMRTVSFLGWTLPVDFFIGGCTAPPDAPGLIGGTSAIDFVHSRYAATGGCQI